MQGGHLQTPGLAPEVDEQEIDREATEQEQKEVQELHLGMVEDGCQHQVERGKEHDGRDDDGDLQGTRRQDLDDEDGRGRRYMGPRSQSLQDTWPGQGSHLLGSREPSREQRRWGPSLTLSRLWESPVCAHSRCLILPCSPSMSSRGKPRPQQAESTPCDPSIPHPPGHTEILSPIRQWQHFMFLLQGPVVQRSASWNSLD